MRLQNLRTLGEKGRVVELAQERGRHIDRDAEVDSNDVSTGCANSRNTLDFTARSAAKTESLLLLLLTLPLRKEFSFFLSFFLCLSSVRSFACRSFIPCHYTFTFENFSLESCIRDVRVVRNV